MYFFILLPNIEMPTFIIDNAIQMKNELEIQLELAINEKKIDRIRQLNVKIEEYKVFIGNCFAV